MKKLIIFLVTTVLLLAGFWFFIPNAGRWDANDIETHLSSAPYSNPSINPDATVEQRLGIEWNIHQGTVEYADQEGKVTVSQNEAAGMAIITYKGPAYQGMRIVSGGLFACSTDTDFVRLLELYLAQATQGFGGMKFARSPFGSKQVDEFMSAIKASDAGQFSAPCDTIVEEMKREAAESSSSALPRR